MSAGYRVGSSRMEPNSTGVPSEAALARRTLMSPTPSAAQAAPITQASSDARASVNRACCCCVGSASAGARSSLTAPCGCIQLSDHGVGAALGLREDSRQIDADDAHAEYAE